MRELGSALAVHLPTYMVPAAIVPLSRLPLNASTKLDRKILRQLLAAMDSRALGQFCAASGAGMQMPSTLQERHMQSLWASVLGRAVQDIGSTDHFFQLGGDSVTAMKLVAIARS
nr:nonribosomal peptide synthetase dtxs1 [Quercus suber]